MAKINPSVKHDNEENWNKAINYIPPIGEIIIYDTEEENISPRIKIGDGKRAVNDLPFLIQPKYEVKNDELTIS